VDWDRNGFIYFAAKDRNPFDFPRSPEEFRANAGANDVYRIRADGSRLQRLVTTPSFGEADVGVSEDGLLMAFIAQPLESSPSHTEIWVTTSEGTNPRLVFVGGEVGISSVHDPELSPDNSRVAFSMVNSTVPPNFPDNPAANTAHDLWQTSLDGTELRRLTRPGPISIAPDWKNNTILYLDISERDRYAGVSLIDPAGTEQLPRRINSGANIAKWIP
jgi:Tol biopolymer transport system component